MLTVLELDVVSVGLETVVSVVVFVSSVFGLVVVFDVVLILVPSDLTLSVNDEFGPS